MKLLYVPSIPFCCSFNAEFKRHCDKTTDFYPLALLGFSHITAWSTLSVRDTRACFVCVLGILTQRKVPDYNEVDTESNMLKDAPPHTPAEPAAGTFSVPIPMIDATASSQTLVNV
jgi:hypothetical protein